MASAFELSGSEAVEKHALGQHEPDIRNQRQKDDEIGGIQEKAQVDPMGALRAGILGRGNGLQGRK